MKKSEALAIRRKIEHAAAQQTDEDALDSVELFPLWKAGEEVEVGIRWQYDGVLYKCIQAHTTSAEWTPDITPALWTRVSIEEWPAWVQPAGATDAYNIGDKVSHNDKHWQSLVDGNVWEPSEAVPTLWQLVAYGN